MSSDDEWQAPLSAALAELDASKASWASLGAGEMEAVLGRCVTTMTAAAEEWVERACEAKRIPPGTAARGEEWSGGPYSVISAINALRRTLGAVAAGRSPLQGFPTRTVEGTPLPDGSGGTTRTPQQAVKVFPASTWDSMLLSGFEAEVWQHPSVTAENQQERVASCLLRRPRAPGIALVLGAGNVTSIPALDALYKLVAEGQVVLVKLNPFTDLILEPMLKGLAPLVECGALRVVKGGGREGAWLCDHPSVDSLHITGSGATHDVIVYGPGAEGAARKAARNPRNPRRMTSELGCVGPTLVVPGGAWSAADLRFQAEHLVAQKLQNRGNNCIASQLIVLAEDWEHKDELMRNVREVLTEVADVRPDWYGGVAQRRDALVEGREDSCLQRFGAGGEVVVITGLRPGSGDRCFSSEVFAPVWGVVELPGVRTPEAFLTEAVRFANDEVTGTLGAQFIVHPDVERAHPEAMQEAIAGMRYGTLGVNAWSAVGFVMPFAPWGAFDGEALDEAQLRGEGLPDDVGSGVGVVHNALLLDLPQKVVVRGPFTPFPRTLLRAALHSSPKPVWFVSHAKADKVLKAFTYFEATKSLSIIPGLFYAALTG